ncbi:14770_t:CDS:2, partial [Funneliformis caledonium]
MGIHLSKNKQYKELGNNNEDNNNEQEINKERKYYLPNDNEDVDRLHTAHFLTRYLYTSNFSSPIEKKLIQGGAKVIDVACGPGTWLLDVAGNYMESCFIGIDLEFVFPSEIKPKNLVFVQADILNGLPYNDDEFDFVHQENMMHTLESDKWDFVISELVRITKPGGYIELFESSTSRKDIGPKFNEFLDAPSIRGVDMNITPRLPSMLQSHQNICN